uniref:aminotransferase-like domain-containing protein n=1 Tax=Sphingomonas populi TaxID=2484750 RepID=UPI0019D22BA7|nr:PLP-dependent aminotransferase family protein [Sphingomonas populi]
MTDWHALYASRMRDVVASDIRERMKLLAAKEIIHLGGGLPDPDIFPYAAVAAASDRIWSNPTLARTALQYSPSEGHGPLRAWIADYMTGIGAPCGVENILITSGSQQGLDFVAKLLLSPVDRAMVEIPSFIGALRAFDAYEPNYVGLAGGDPTGVKFCYAGPDFRNPTGTTMSLAEREDLLDMADASGMAILEDGCYERLRYDGQPIQSLLALACARHGSIEDVPVLYTGTFSKTIAPSLRIGWIAGPAAVIRKLVLIKQASDLATSALNQMLLLDVVQHHLADSTATACAAYRGRRDSMLEALAEHMPAGVRWTRPEGGLYVWVELPKHLDATRLTQRALAEHGVSAIAGAAFYPRGIPAERNTMRLSFSMIPSEPARQGVARLGALASEMLSSPQR